MSDDDDRTPHITGYFVRVERDGKWQNSDIASMTDAELDAFLERQGVERHGMWVKALAGWIRDHVVRE